MYDFKLKGLIVRSRARWVEHGEKSTKYFFNLERRNKVYNTIHSLHLDTEEVCMAGRKILVTLKNYFERLYQSKGVDVDVNRSLGDTDNDLKIVILNVVRDN